MRLPGRATSSASLKRTPANRWDSATRELAVFTSAGVAYLRVQREADVSNLGD